MYRVRFLVCKHTVLFILIGCAAWLVWSNGIFHKKSRLTKASGENVNVGCGSKEGINSLVFDSSNRFSNLVELSIEWNPMLCDQECMQFRNLLSNWPQHKPKAAIYYLVKTDRLPFLDISLRTLYHSFLNRYDYPVIVFHEPGAFHLLRQMFRRRVELDTIRLFMQEVQFSIPSHVNASAVGIRCFSPISYHHMCRFQAKQIYEQPILVGLDYVWRLDDDSQILANINYDLFAFMRHHHLQYGYIKKHWDACECTVGLWNAVRHYMKLKHIESSSFNNWPEPRIFYNNFEISAFSLWTSKQYQDYIHFIDMLGGIYYYRWGDAPIKSIAVSLFVPESATHLFDDITYKHGNFYKNATYSSF